MKVTLKLKHGTAMPHGSCAGRAFVTRNEYHGIRRVHAGIACGIDTCSGCRWRATERMSGSHGGCWGGVHEGRTWRRRAIAAWRSE